MEAEQDAEHGGHALAAAEAEEDGIEVAEEGGGAGEAEHQGRDAQPVAGQHRQQALEHVAEQGDGGGRLAAHPQHVGGAGVAGALGARIGQAHQPADEDGRGDGAEQVGDEDQAGVGERHAATLPGMAAAGKG